MQFSHIFFITVDVKKYIKYPATKIIATDEMF